MNIDKATDEVASYMTNLALEKGLSVNSCDAYRIDLIDLIQFLSIRNVASWESVSALDISDYVSQLYDIGIAATTVSRRLSAFRGFYKHLQREGIATHNPAKLVLGPRESRKLPAVLSLHDIEKLLESLQGDKPMDIKNLAIIEVLYGCGLRVSELTGLRLSNLLADGKVINVTGKGDKQRLVPMGGMARQAVLRYLKDVRPSLVKNAKDARDSIFLSQRHGKPMSRQAIWQLIKKLALQAGISTAITPHTFRHSFATHLLEGGAGLRDVQEFLGHASIETTNIYTHIDKGHLLEVVRTFHPRG